MITAEEIAARAAKGAKKMDGLTLHGKPWFKSVNLDELDMMKCHRCAWGQLHGIFHARDFLESGIDPFEYGFAIDVPDVDGPNDSIPRFVTAYKMLTEAWKAEIVKRRKSA